MDDDTREFTAAEVAELAALLDEPPGDDDR